MWILAQQRSLDNGSFEAIRFYRRSRKARILRKRGMVSIRFARQVEEDTMLAFGSVLTAGSRSDHRRTEKIESGKWSDWADCETCLAMVRTIRPDRRHYH